MGLPPPARAPSRPGSPDWDIIADNIAFVPEGMIDSFAADSIPRRPASPFVLTTAQFIDGNVSRPDRPRGELGFLIPIIRRAFLDQHGLSYDERLRLGEDFALYAEMMRHGARFIAIKTCGYVAVERAGSLSGQHRTADLAALLAFNHRLAASAGLDSESLAALDRHRRHLKAKLNHREILDIRAARGRWRAAAEALRQPGLMIPLTRAILRDKLTAGTNEAPADGVRYLFQ